MRWWRGPIRDVRALGVGAPLRVGYEASKRYGGHSLVFGRLATGDDSLVTGHSPFEVGDVPDAVRERTIAAADRIVAGSVEIFGRTVRVDGTPEWHATLDGMRSWPVAPWWTIDIRSEDRVGDVKWTWELGRHRHLVILARAIHLDVGNAAYAETLNRHLASWLDLNPPEIGIHWYSNLELSLRALKWLEIMALADHALDEDVRSGMWRHLYHTGRHVMADIPYTYSTMRNNHMFGDGLGLIALGRAFEGDLRAGRWLNLGSKLFDSQLRRHCHPDGSMIEDSVSYHRFVLEMLEMRVLLGDPPGEVGDAMERSAQFLSRLGVIDGEVPQYGDWDEGRVFAVAEHPQRLQGSVLLGLALAGSGACEEWRTDHDEVGWYCGVGRPVPPEVTVSGRVGGGVGRAARGPWSVWLKGGGGTSHGHADLSSVAIAHDKQWIIGDPGTGTYNGPLEMRNYFRTSGAHDVVRVEGEDQYGPHRTFRWERRPLGVLGEPIAGDDVTVLWSVHNAYRTTDGRGRVVRLVAVGAHAVAIADHIDGASLSCFLTLPLHPGVAWDSSGGRLTVGDETLALTSPAPFTETKGSTEPYRGWWSETYGTTEPATVLDCSFSQQSIVWGLGETPPSVHVLMDSMNRSVVFDRASVTLTVTVDGDCHVRSVAL